MADQKSTPLAKPTESLDLGASVAGEEDPGASLDIGNAPGRPDPPSGPLPGAQAPAGQAPTARAGAPTPMAPGDEAPPGTPGTGENLCPRCGGDGRLGSVACPECAGTGKVIVGIAGGG